MGRDDSDGPGHAPRYLDVRPKMKDGAYKIAVILGVYCLIYIVLRMSGVILHYHSVIIADKFGYSHAVLARWNPKLTDNLFIVPRWVETSILNRRLVSRM